MAEPASTAAPPEKPAAATPPPDKPTTPPPPQETAGERPPSEWMADIEQDFAEMAQAPKEPDKPAKPAKSGKAAPKAAKPPEKAPDDKDTDPSDKTSGVKPPDQIEPVKPTEPDETIPKKTSDLRLAYEGLKKRVREEFEPQIQTLKSKLTELEKRTPEESEQMLEKVKTLEQRNQELEKLISFVDYRESAEFEKEYATPYREAWNNAVTDFNRLTVRVKGEKDEYGEVKWTTRAATEEDLLRLANMNLSEMDAEAVEMFGPSAARATAHITKLQDLAEKQRQAIENAKTKAVDQRSKRKQEQESKIKEMGKAWSDINTSLKQKFPLAYTAEEGNADDKTAFDRGFALADLMFLGGDALTPEQIEALPAGFRETVKEKKVLSPVQVVHLHALARLKMANHDRKIAALKKATARIAELEKALAEYESSEPPVDAGGEPGEKVSRKDWLEQAGDELRAMDK